MSERAPICVSVGIASTCSRCHSSDGLWNEDRDPNAHCGRCGAELDWGTVVDEDADGLEREPRVGELDPPDEPAAPREEYQAVGLALANELRALSVQCFELAAAVAEIDDEKLGGEGLRRMAAGLALDLAPWGDMKMPLRRHPCVDPRAYDAADLLARHPGEWRADDDGRIHDELGQAVEVSPGLIAVTICTLRNTERDSRWKLDGARREIAALRRRLRKEGVGK